MQQINSPTVIETSRWTKSVMFKACRLLELMLWGLNMTYGDGLTNETKETEAKATSIINHQSQYKREEKAVTRIGEIEVVNGLVW